MTFYGQGGHHGGKTALAFAADTGQDAIVHALVAAGAELNAADVAGRRPLHLSILRGHSESSLALIAAGADTEVEDTEASLRPLHIACLKGRVDVVRALIDAGADISAREQVRASRRGSSAVSRENRAPSLSPGDPFRAGQHHCTWRH